MQLFLKERLWTAFKNNQLCRKIANRNILIFDLVQYLILIWIFILHSVSAWGQGAIRKFLNQGQLKRSQYITVKANIQSFQMGEAKTVEGMPVE